jgi:malonyl-CoA/methylmalonyl-CoA synthetase
MLLGDLFDLSLKHRAKVPALVADSPGGTVVELTFGEIHDRAAQVAHALSRLGLAAGDRVVVHLTNRIEFVELFIACLKSGLVFVPVNILYREREIAHIVADADPALVVTTATGMLLFPDHVRVIDVEELSREASSLESWTIRPSIDGESPAAIVYTSGTTGRSRLSRLKIGHRFASPET